MVMGEKGTVSFGAETSRAEEASREKEVIQTLNGELKKQVGRRKQVVQTLNGALKKQVGRRTFVELGARSAAGTESAATRAGSRA